MKKLFTYCTDNREVFYGMAALLLIMSGRIGALFGGAIIGHLAAKAWLQRNSQKSADTKRLDWLETNDEYAIGHPFAAGNSWHLFFNDDGKDVEATTLRAAIDHAMHAAPAAPEGK